MLVFSVQVPAKTGSLKPFACIERMAIANFGKVYASRILIYFVFGNPGMRKSFQTRDNLKKIMSGMPGERECGEGIPLKPAFPLKLFLLIRENGGEDPAFTLATYHSPLALPPRLPQTCLF